MDIERKIGIEIDRNIESRMYVDEGFNMWGNMKV